MTARRPALPRIVLLLASTHFVVDGYGNILTPLLPLLISRLSLTLAAAGTLQMCFQLANSVAQLGFGHLADRWRPRVLLVGGPLLAVVMLPLVGLAPDFWTLAGVLIVGGLGGAAFHPPAAALVHRHGGMRKGLAMAVHITGGSFGFSLGPLVFAPFVQRFGLHATPALILPAAALLGLFLRRVPPVERLQEARDTGGLRTLRPYARPLTLLYLIVVLRTLTAISFSTFVPIMLTRRGLTLAEAGTIVAIYLMASGIGGFFGGPLADRWGARRVIVASLVAATPFLALAPALSGWQFVAVLAAGGLLLQSTLPVNVTFGQMIAPISAATVSSLMMGFAWGTGGLAVPLVGLAADRIGIERTLEVIACLPLVAAALAWPLPAKSTPGLTDADRQSPGTDVAR